MTAAGAEEPLGHSKSSSAMVGKERARARRGRGGPTQDAGGNRQAGANSTVDRSFSGSPSKSLVRLRKKTQSSSPMKLAQWRKFEPLDGVKQLKQRKTEHITAAEINEPK